MDNNSSSNIGINQTIVSSTFSAASSTSSNDPSFLIIGLLMQAMLSSPGIIPNIAIVYITFKHKSIQTIYGWLLCHTAFWDALSGFSFVLPLVLVSFRQKIPLMPCFFVQFYDSIGLFQNILLLFAISLDRLCAICMPINYMHITATHTKAIVYGTNLLATAVNYFQFHFQLLYVLSNPYLPVYCLTNDLVAGPIAVPIYYTTVGLSVLIFAVYVLIWILMKIGGLKYQQSHNRRIFKSLAVITSLIFICYTASYTLRNVLSLLPMDANTKALMNKLIGNLSRLAGASNALVLYICSTHYREIFCKEFSCIARLDELSSSSTRVHNLAAGSTTANPPQRQMGSP